MSHDEFVEYPVGYVKMAYSGDCVEANTHQSGWATRNANNHNQVGLLLHYSIHIKHCAVIG